ncbi:MAG: hypothetical protein MUC29_02595 [Pyrinomonadaceae bacterium]|jgi:hypothetical protein|nr:hypothetical protein [Pyrinomonadaceae bacterium]
MLKNKFSILLVVLVCVFSTLAQESSTTANSSNESISNLSKQTVSDKTRKFEVGIQFTSLMKKDDGDRNGIGSRFGYNFATFGNGKYVATAEAEVNYFTGNRFVSDLRRNGRVTQGLFGVKVGRKFDKFGVFAKVRPGFTRYSQGKPGDFISPTQVSEPKGNYNFTTDVGGVLEFYPTKRIITRFDFGDSIVRLKQQQVNTFLIGIGGTPIPFTFTLPAKTNHNFQFNAGIGFRF